MDQVHHLMCRKQNSIHLVEPSLYAHQEETPWCLYYLGVSINPRMYKQIYIPTMVQGGGGGWMEPFRGVFDMLQYSETILPLVESLWSS